MIQLEEKDHHLTLVESLVQRQSVFTVVLLDFVILVLVHRVPFPLLEVAFVDQNRLLYDVLNFVRRAINHLLAAYLAVKSVANCSIVALTFALEYATMIRVEVVNKSWMLLATVESTIRQSSADKDYQR